MFDECTAVRKCPVTAREAADERAFARVGAPVASKGVQLSKQLAATVKGTSEIAGNVAWLIFTAVDAPFRNTDGAADSTTNCYRVFQTAPALAWGNGGMHDECIVAAQLLLIVLFLDAPAATGAASGRN